MQQREVSIERYGSVVEKLSEREEARKEKHELTEKTVDK